ncbi:30S ribosomal protein S2 [Candidatus Giovannonibacteria bacterium]|nr:30S ribosomal protein S2 [Candidatus Giovannonibacteria bacterium]
MAIDAELKEPGAPENEKGFAGNKELEELFRAGTHFAYSRSRRHPTMAPFIYGIKNNVEVFDLEKVSEKLKAAEAFLAKLGEAKRNVLWVGTKPSIKNMVEETAKKLGLPYVSERWLGGTLTNAKVFKERIKYFEELKRKKETGEIDKYTKKEQLQISRELGTLGKYLSGIVSLKNEISAIVLVDPGEEKTAFHEALKVKLPIVAICSSDNALDKVDYPIPANDTSPASVGYILKRLAASYEAGLQSAPPPDNRSEQ